MERLAIVEEDQRDYRHDHQREGVEEQKIEEIFADDEDGVDDDSHFFVRISENSENFDYSDSSEVIIDDEIAIGNESSHNYKDYAETDNITLRLLQEPFNTIRNAA